jgi:hypothetical protein
LRCTTKQVRSRPTWLEFPGSVRDGPIDGHLITVYGKDQKDDLSAGEKKLYREFVRIPKDESRRTREA